MNPESVDSLKSFFSDLWSLLGSISVPGTFLTLQHLLVAPLGAIVFVTALKKILDIGGAVHSSGSSIGSGDGYYPESDNKGQED